jgi:hypothetical protein
MEEQIVVTLESLVEEVQAALKYGMALGYSECLSHTVQGKPVSSNPERAMKHYVDTLVKEYTED